MLASEQHLAIGSEHDLHARQWAPDSAQSVVYKVVQVRGCRRLCHAVAFKDRKP